jgi:three-Cys-motif partner protein
MSLVDLRVRCVEMSSVKTKIDPADGLPAIVTGEWARKKHKLVRHYVNISRAARRGWVDPAEAARRNVQGGPRGAAYIELFCGPGRICIEDLDIFENGSPLVAYDESARSRTAFTAMHLGDERVDFCDAVESRLQTRGVSPNMYRKSAEQSAKEIVTVLDPYGLNFAFLDPFGFEGLPFAIIETLGRFKRMDVLIYVSAMGLQRDLPKFVESSHCPLDEFAPDWRSAARGMDPSDIVTRGKVFEHWVSLIRKAGFQEAKGKPALIRGPQNQALYWLVLVAKHELATKFWEQISRDENQDDIFSGQ